MSTPPRTAKEALFAEMLGDMDRMLSRMEQLPELVENCELRLRDAAAILESAGEQYGQAVAAFTEQAKGELAVFLENESAKIIERQAESVKKVMHTSRFSETGSRELMPKQKWPVHLLTHGATALVSFLFTILLF